ncbi:MAG: hypothetical protein EOO61_06305 [Hymenobacter sp.]|nr:MAG: hypothetical protein EOO61_06305 [Hymenobacter sp.]
MRNFTSSFAAGFAAVALLLAAPTAHAQSPGFLTAGLRTVSTGEMASMRTLDTNGGKSPSEMVRNLSTPADEAATSAYYNDSHKDLKQALAWVQETNAMHPSYHTLYAEARIRLQLKDYAGAQTTAAEAKKLALAAANADYARRSDEVMTKSKANSK